MTIVRTVSGEVRGRDHGHCTSHLAIPYALAPVGELRWAPPVAVDPWEGVRDCTALGAAGWQLTGGPLDGLVPGMGSDHQGDDHLHVNVWAPTTPGPHPVLVWIHGGAFQLGANSLGVYDGQRLASTTDTVVVTINYRLGALGFLLLDDESTAPNVGLLDQCAALAWVRTNIASFGGDPRNVTIFGESAGGGSVLSLLSMPAAQPLFDRAIVQSGATDLLLTRDAAREVAATFARCAGVDVADIDALRALTPEQVLAAQAQSVGELFATVGTMPFHPCIDGDVLPRSWQEAAEAGTSAKPVIIGTTRDEMSLFGSFDPAAATLDDAALDARLSGSGLDPVAVRAAYAAAGTTAPPEVWARLMTDRAMWMPAIRWASARCASAPTHMYRFDWTASAPGMGAPHGVDIPFAFGTIDRDGWDEFVSDPLGAEGLSATIRHAWSTFARDGEPDLGGTPWPRYDVERRATAILGPTVTVVDDPEASVRTLWS